MPISTLAAALSAFDLRPDEAEDALPLSDKVRMALLDRLEAWIDEEERLIAEIDLRIAATFGAAPRPRTRANNAPEPDGPNDGQTMTEQLSAA